MAVDSVAASPEEGGRLAVARRAPVSAVRLHLRTRHAPSGLAAIPTAQRQVALTGRRQETLPLWAKACATGNGILSHRKAVPGSFVRVQRHEQEHSRAGQSSVASAAVPELADSAASKVLPFSVLVFQRFVSALAPGDLDLDGVLDSATDSATDWGSVGDWALAPAGILAGPGIRSATVRLRHGPRIRAMVTTITVIRTHMRIPTRRALATIRITRRPPARTIPNRLTP